MTSASRITAPPTPTASTPPSTRHSSNCRASRASPLWVRRRTTIWTCSTGTSSKTCLPKARRDGCPTTGRGAAAWYSTRALVRGKSGMGVDDDRVEEELARSRSLRRRALDLQRHLAGVAAAVSRTEDEVADVHEEIAEGDSEVAAQAPTVAAEARRMAEAERKERKRLSSEI